MLCDSTMALWHLVPELILNASSPVKWATTPRAEPRPDAIQPSSRVVHCVCANPCPLYDFGIVPYGCPA